MADITMCFGKHCALRETCYRYKANRNPYRQSYFKDDPYNYDLMKCEMYWKFDNKERFDKDNEDVF